jgi:hypothetical protein
MNLSTLKKVGDGRFLGGCGTKDIYRDADGQKWIFKHATPKFFQAGTKPSFEPWRIHAQRISAFLTGLLKPNASIPVFPAEFEGVPGTLQPLIDCVAISTTNFSVRVAPALMDIAREHIADWIGSQHDSHIGNWIGRRSDGALICTDKEQGYKYFGRDKLSTDYHPNASYGERPPLYNAFWKAWAKKEFELPLDEFWESFDPLYAHVDRVRQFAALLDDYAKSCPPEFKRDDVFITAAMKRYIDAKSDFTKFLHSLRGKE